MERGPGALVLGASIVLVASLALAQPAPAGTVRARLGRRGATLTIARPDASSSSSYACAGIDIPVCVQGRAELAFRARAARGPISELALDVHLPYRGASRTALGAPFDRTLVQRWDRALHGRDPAIADPEDPASCTAAALTLTAADGTPIEVVAGTLELATWGRSQARGTITATVRTSTGDLPLTARFDVSYPRLPSGPDCAGVP